MCVVTGRQYQFRVRKLSTKSGEYADIMIKDCASLGMKPVCEHPNYCRTDPKSIYIGQSHHLS